MLQYSLFFRYPHIVHPKSPLLGLKLGMWAIFLIFSLFLSIGPVQAGQVSALYDVEVLVTDESTSVRQQAFTEGMKEIFIRIAGDSVVMDKLEHPAANQYVKKFSYAPVKKTSTNEKGEVLSRRLKIKYNGSLMEKYLRDNGFSVWGEHRSDVMVWIAVRDGKNEYVLKDTDRSLIKSVTNAALIRRGIPGVWPLYDSKDKKKISIADLRGGFEDQVVEASKRYSRGPILTASLSWNGKQWQSRWSLLMATGNSHWSFAGKSYKSLINKAVNQAADTMGAVFAVRGMVNNQSFSSIQLNVQAVNSIEKYRRVENYLANLSAVEQTKVLDVDGQSITFELMLRSNEVELLNIIKNGGKLAKTQAIKIEQKPAPISDPMPVLIDGKVAQPVADSNAVKSNVNISMNQLAPVPVHYYRLIK